MMLSYHDEAYALAAAAVMCCVHAFVLTITGLDRATKTCEPSVDKEYSTSSSSATKHPKAMQQCPQLQDTYHVALYF